MNSNNSLLCLIIVKFLNLITYEKFQFCISFASVLVLIGISLSCSQKEELKPVIQEKNHPSALKVSLPDSLIFQLANSADMSNYFDALDDFYEPFIDEYNTILDTTTKKKFISTSDSLYSLYDSTGNSTDKTIWVQFMGYASTSDYETLANSVVISKSTLSLHPILNGLTAQEKNEAISEAMGIAIDVIEIGVPIIRDFDPPTTPPADPASCKSDRTDCYKVAHDFAYKFLDEVSSIEAVTEIFITFQNMIDACDECYVFCKKGKSCH